MKKPPPQILIVEDSIVSALMMEATLNRKKPEFDVEIARTLRAGKEAFDRSKPAIVILDLALPDSDAHETLESINYFAPASCVLVVSGHPEYEDAARTAGAFDFMPKGIGDDPTPFIERISKMAGLCS